MSSDEVIDSGDGAEELSTDEYTKVYEAVVLGIPDPFGTEASKAAYAVLKAEVDAKPDARWDIPGEIPEADGPEPSEPVDAAEPVDAE